MALLQDIPAPLTPAAATRVLVLRNYVVYKDAWKLFITGFLEPVFYLFSIGIGVGQLIDTFEFHGEAIPYAEFVAPAMLATSAFNGALLDSTYNVFFKLKYEKLYDQMLATPLSTSDIARGEIAWGLTRGSVYSSAFLVVMAVMGLTTSWWALLALPATILIAFAFSAVCMAVTTWMMSISLNSKISRSTTAVRLTGSSSGKVISQKVCHRPPPSIFAASKISPGIACRPARSITITNGMAYQAFMTISQNTALGPVS